ncbi:hypothetical protein DET59_105304 [Rossellomorea aquimaris]|uniref:Uncharacterized protein n=1 Tax=Rossellomorea aquimaris TaxID=189382 RepID=A0A366ETJ1_9BACI|nr:hypothetical protein DET59_105304 [Rossellomorea aquimaris]
MNRQEPMPFTWGMGSFSTLYLVIEGIALVDSFQKVRLFNEELNDNKEKWLYESLLIFR